MSNQYLWSDNPTVKTPRGVGALASALKYHLFYIGGFMPDPTPSDFMPWHGCPYPLVNKDHQTKFGSSLDQVWTEFGPSLDQVWTKFGPGLD